MPKKVKKIKTTKKSSTSSFHQAFKSKDTCPRWAAVAIVALIVLGLGYLWAYGKKIDVKPAEVMKQSTFSCVQKCQKEVDKCKKDCQTECGGKGGDNKACNDSCRVANNCKNRNCNSECNPSSGINYSCSTEPGRTGDCILGESEACKNDTSSGESFKFVCEKDPSGSRPAGKGCWVKTVYTAFDCQDSTWKNCGADGLLTDCLEDIQRPGYYFKKFCVNKNKVTRWYSDASCKHEINAPLAGVCGPTYNGLCIGDQVKCVNGTQVADSSCHTSVKCDSLPPCPSSGGSCSGYDQTCTMACSVSFNDWGVKCYDSRYNGSRCCKSL